jgi:predicted dehydrogenase
MNDEFPDLDLGLKHHAPARRELLRRIAGGAAASAVLAGLPWFSPLKAQPAGKNPSDRVRIGLIGTGSRGQVLLEHLLKTPAVEIAGLCDVYAPNLEAAQLKVGKKVPHYSDYRALLDDKTIDAVVIATPLHLHAPMCLSAFAAGKSVYCEKSLALTIEECKAVAVAADQSPQVFQIGHQRLFHRSALHALSQVKAGDLGPITQIRAYWHRNIDWRRPVPSPDLEPLINWRLYRQFSAGLMTELASHHLHVANWFLDAPPVACVGYGSINYWKDGREVFDNVNVIYKYPGGVSFVYDSLSSNRFHGLEVQIMGPKGTLELETSRFYREIPPPAPGIVQLINQIEKGIFERVPIGGPSWVPDLKKDTKGIALPEDPGHDDGTGLSLAAFASAVRLKEKMPYMVEHAYRSGVAALMGVQAMEEGREVLWPGDYRS